MVFWKLSPIAGVFHCLASLLLRGSYVYLSFEIILKFWLSFLPYHATIFLKIDQSATAYVFLVENQTFFTNSSDTSWRPLLLLNWLKAWRKELSAYTLSNMHNKNFETKKIYRLMTHFRQFPLPLQNVSEIWGFLKVLWCLYYNVLPLRLLFCLIPLKSESAPSKKLLSIFFGSHSHVAHFEYSRLEALCFFFYW